MKGIPAKWNQGHAGQILADFVTPKLTRGAHPIEFDITINKSGFPDFIVTHHLYERCVKTHWRIGMRLSVEFDELIDGQMASKRYNGRIVNISDSDHNNWRRSPWDCLEVVWDDSAGSTEGDRVNPWEASAFFAEETSLAAAVRDLKPTRLQDELTQRVLTAIRALEEADEFQEFKDAVDPELFAEYYCFVPVPMYLTLIETRLANGYYRQVSFKSEKCLYCILFYVE